MTETHALVTGLGAMIEDGQEKSVEKVLRAFASECFNDRVSFEFAPIINRGTIHVKVSGSTHIEDETLHIDRYQTQIYDEKDLDHETIGAFILRDIVYIMYKITKTLAEMLFYNEKRLDDYEDSLFNILGIGP